ncbi:hypothetical protein K9B32_28100 [Rhizobium sp. 3T7]|uniref:hypothetical protein n=1 Tax=Rhizobium sp. 3T7 TaxID=2874922 RepID=UPI001CCA9FBC|nr:hypothetical protein [Rhizobium sp. 3T7]MBZ9793912.1 hypothetical protein [Rhizobium sp. 3T7]
MPCFCADLPRCGIVHGPPCRAGRLALSGRGKREEDPGRREIEEARDRLDRRIADYLSGLDTADASEPDDAGGAVESAMAMLESRRGELDRMAGLTRQGARPWSRAKRMRARWARATKDVLSLDSLTVVADAGYSNGAQASACEDDGITPCAPANRTVNNTGDGTLFDRTAFAYDVMADRFVCPQGRMLERKQVMNRDRLVFYAKAGRLWPLHSQIALHHRLKTPCQPALR